ncbi:DUF4294 domain-containing protein [Elizabethkingia sp. JS20170427COW]|uniref:DUF4294 domain-containing protein n=1 Tax=Elizabethkingia sp. JS20170427COW TaxID=2583851 RepID=UPI001110A390|nr:DUF4294 domain-containing protein [Elizabethkingia sp. JS20170427COW]QCX54271.1 DUF4294 domain-containing protein [Elizabethkingia sp. JS20170427COW]
MKNYRIYGIVCLLFFSVSYAQKNDSMVIGDFGVIPQSKLQTDKDGRQYYWDDKLQAKVFTESNGDKLIEMEEMTLIHKPHFNNQLDKQFYNFLNKKLNRVYPLFIKALEQYRNLNQELAAMPENERRRFAKARQNELAAQYEAQLRDLTTTEGQVFAKLMYRAEGKTVYEIIKELRGGWSAFWWNIKGKVADIDLKKEYNPYYNRDDEFIESLLQSNWNFGLLTPYPGYKNFKIKKGFFD